MLGGEHGDAAKVGCEQGKCISEVIGFTRILILRKLFEQ